MKKLIPDPPPALCVGLELSHTEATKRAAEHLNRSILKAAYLRDPPDSRHGEMLNDELLNMRISKVLLALALAASPLTINV